MAAVSVLVVGACGVGDKARQAELISASRTKAAAAGSATATLLLRSTPARSATAIRTASDGSAPLAGLGRQGPAALELPVQFDFASGRTGVLLPPAVPPPAVEGEPALETAAPIEGPTVVFERTTAFAQRVNRRPAERRVWARLDFGDLRDDERSPDQADFSPAERLETLAKSLNPSFVLDLTAGTLAGSVEQVGDEAIDGLPTVHYRANVSLEKSMSELDLSEDEIETRSRVFRLVGIGRDVNPVDYWLAEDGRLRRARFRFDQRLPPRVHNAVSVTLDLRPEGGTSSLEAPADDQTIRLQRYARFVRTAVARTEG